jgi:phosphoribosylformylglycinamidine cyclo-ligase
MSESAYKQAGVDIEEAYSLVKNIKPHIKKTERSGVMSGIGGFGALFYLKDACYKDPILVSGTDGVGTKLKIAIDTNRHDTIGIDAVAMCVNDIVVQGAEPLFFLDYFATGKLDAKIAETVIAGIAEGCAQAGCALIGGETAEMPGMYAAGDYDIAGFSVGAVERDKMITGARIEAGDVILGLAASGVHSNGFSLVRKLVADTQGFDFESPAPYGDKKTLGEELLTPTRIYVRSLLEALKIEDSSGDAAITGMAHITGGGLIENVPRVLPEGVTAKIDIASWPLLPVFEWLGEIGQLSATDIANTFNCGLGMVVICRPDHAQEIQENLESSGETVYRIGEITSGSEGLILDNLEETWAFKK